MPSTIKKIRSSRSFGARALLIVFGLLLILSLLIQPGIGRDLSAAPGATRLPAGAPAAPQSGTTAKYVIVMIGDGMGPEHVKAARYYKGSPLSFESLPYQAEMTTYSASSSITDSAAAASTMATGVKVNNGVISLALPGDGSELTTTLEEYKALGKAVGLVSTAYVSHATPAGWGAHEPSRNDYSDIAADYMNQTQPHVLLGGAKYVSQTAAQSAGYSVVTDRASMLAVNTETPGLMLSGQFGSDYMPYEYDGLGNLPHLSEMTTTALNILDNDPDGFFLMSESARIDHAGHSNDRNRNIQETIEFGNTIQQVMDWVDDTGNDSNWNNTLLVVTADHETGGLSVLADNGQGNYPTVSWSTGGHTGVNVNIYARGVGADQVSGVLDNSDIYQITTAAAQQNSVTFAAIGDFGGDNANEGYVADMIAGWNPDFIVTTGDNYYNNAGGSGTGKYDESIGKYYCAFLQGISTTGSSCPNGTASVNSFFPSLGNHDYSDAGNSSASNYLSYFDLPGIPGNSSGNERYYDFVQGPVHFFAINSNSQEPDGRSSSSAQANWLQTQLAQSTAPWKIVYFHHASYSTASAHGDTSTMQWPFDQWGVDVVLNGHDHTYERLEKDGVWYFVTGNSGWNLRSNDCYGSSTGATSYFCYDDHYGAMRITATDSQLTLEEVIIDDGANGANGGQVIDTLTLPDGSPTPTPSPTATVPGTGTGTILRQWWTGIAGTAVSDLTGSPDYPDNPTGEDYLTTFEAPIDWADSYGTRVRGYIHPPVSGDYTFWISSDDNGELYLSSDNDPANAALIANVPGWTSSREWNKYTAQQSNLITLQAGSTYYIEALMKEGGGGDNLAVAWQIPGGSQEVIPGQYLSPWTGTPGTSVTVSFQNGVVPDSSYQGTDDTYISQANSSSNYGSASELLLDGDDPGGSNNDLSSLLRFDISSIPPGSMVEDVTLALDVYDVTTNSYDIYELKQPWVENQATWNLYSSGNSWQTAGATGSIDRGSLVLGTMSPSAAGVYIVSLNADGRALVQSWIDNPGTNHGLIINNSSATNGVDMRSSEYSTPTSRPKITIRYNTAIPPTPTSTPLPPTATPTPDGATTLSFQNGVSPSGAYAGSDDTTISEANSSTNYGAATDILVDGNDPQGSNNDLSAMVRWDISNIPPGSIVDQASITLDVFNITTDSYDLFAIKQPWVELEATWNIYSTGNSWQSGGASGGNDRGSATVGSMSPSATGPYQITLNAEGLALVQSWINDPAANHGLIISNSAGNDGIDMRSNEYGAPASRPELSIRYLPGPSPTPTNTPVPPTATNTPTNTAVPPTATNTPTNTPVPPTATNTPTNTAVPPTATNTPTNTPVPPTATNTPTNTPVPPTATNTPTNTPVPPTATNTPTNTPVPPTATNTPTNTPVPPTATPTNTPVPAGPNLVTGVVNNVGSTGWTTVNLPQSYNSMVVVAAPNYGSGDNPAVVRISNAAGSSFQVRADSPDGSGTVINDVTVYYTVVEEGVYSEAADGIKMEAVKYNSTLTDGNGSWLGESRPYSNAYNNPVVLGQVMTYNDPDWSAFWSRGSSVGNPPSSSVLFTGKMVGEDSDTTRTDETVGYIVLEAGVGEVNGLNFVAGLGADSILGFGDSPPYSYGLSGLETVNSAIVSMSAMDGNNGGWAVLYGANPISTSGLDMAIDEDQLRDSERNHTSEQVAYLVFGTVPQAGSDPHLAYGTVSNVSSSTWTTVPLNHAYDSMVVVAVPNYDAGDPPIVVRLRNSAGSSFEIRVDRADGSTTPISGIDIHFLVVEEGLYTEASSGVKMEAVRYLSTVTDSSSSWVGQSQTPINSYSNPVVLGQVMTYADPDFSTFWAQGTSRTNPPGPGALITGKSVAEDSDKTRADEIIGYIVIEAGTGSIGTANYLAGVGGDTVRGITNGPPFTYGSMAGATTAVLSAAGIDGGNGGWPLLYGPDPVSATTLNLAYDEDQIGDSERSHTTEQVAYIIFD